MDKNPNKSNSVFPPELFVHSVEEMERLGAYVAKRTPPNSIVALYGELGAGKTTFMKGFLREISSSFKEVNSPTFTLVHTYEEEQKRVHHFDLYRMQSQREFISQGFVDYFDLGDICCIEWPEIIAQILPKERLISIQIFHEAAYTRRVLIEYKQ